MPKKPKPFEIAVVSKPKHGLLFDLAKEHGGVTALAKKLGIHPATLSNWINLRSMGTYKGAGKGKGPWSYAHRAKVILRLVKLTGRPIEDIFPDWVRDKLPQIPRELVQRHQVEFVSLGHARNVAGLLPAPEEGVQRMELRAAIMKGLKRLSYREREVIKLRYGLGDGQTYTYEEIAHIFRVTKERIRQLCSQAEHKLCIRTELQPFARDAGIRGHVDDDKPLTAEDFDGYEGNSNLRHN